MNNTLVYIEDLAAVLLIRRNVGRLSTMMLAMCLTDTVESSYISKREVVHHSE